MQRTTIVAAGVWAAAAFVACRAIIGNLDECSTDADCVQKNELVPACVDKLCVEYPGCSTIGSNDPAAVTFGFVIPFTTPSGAPLPGAQQEMQTLDLVLTELNPPKGQGFGGRPARVIACDNGEDSNISARIA